MAANKVRCVLDNVAAKGDMDNKYRAIAVVELMVGGKTAWSRAWVRQKRERLYKAGTS